MNAIANIKKHRSGAGLTSSNSRNDNDASDVEFMFRPEFHMTASRRPTEQNEIDDDNSTSRDSNQQDSNQQDSDSSSNDDYDGNPPLTYLTVQADPSVLTQFANSRSSKSMFYIEVYPYLLLQHAAGQLTD